MATSVSAQSEWSGGPLSRKYAQYDMASVLMDREAKLKTTCGIFIEENSPCRPKKKKQGKYRNAGTAIASRSSSAD